MNLKKSLIKMLAIGMLMLSIAFMVENTFSLGYAGDVTVMSDNDGSGTSANQTLGEIEANSTAAISSVQKTIVTIALAVGPLAIIVCLVLMLFTHDERKIAALTKAAVTILIVLVLILFVNGNQLIALIKDLMGNLVGTQG